MGITHLKGLSITPDPRGATALEVVGSMSLGAPANFTGTTRVSGLFSASAAGKQTTLTKVDVTGTVLVGGRFTITGGKNFRIGSAANAVAGLKSVAAGSVGSGVVATTKVQSSSRILTTPIGIGNLSAYYRLAQANVATIASGVSFKVRLYRTQTMGTIATASGRVAWQIINL